MQKRELLSVSGLPWVFTCTQLPVYLEYLQTNRIEHQLISRNPIRHLQSVLFVPTDSS